MARIAPTRATLRRTAEARLAQAGVDSPRRTATWLLEAALSVTHAALLAMPDAPVASACAARFAALVRRRAAREPLQYVLGHADFYGLRLRVTPAVLIPRPETERVVERALALIADAAAPHVLDVGTGSGCIACAVAHERPTARVVGCDVSADALAVARANADALGVPVTFGAADLTAPDFPAQIRALDARPSSAPRDGATRDGATRDGATRDGAGGFDLVVSNPPYVPDAEAGTLAPEVRDHEPPVALFTGADPLVCYRALARHAAALLRPGGHLVTETHADYAADVAAVFRDAGLADVGTERDLAGRPRLARARRLPAS